MMTPLLQRTLLLIGLLAICGSCTKPPLQPTSHVATTDSGLWQIDYDIDDDQIGFVVITGPNEPEGPVTISGDGSGPKAAYLTKPDGTRISLVNSGRIFHVHKDTVIEFDDSLSPEEFRAFIDTQPESYSFASLRNFLDRYRKSDPQ